MALRCSRADEAEGCPTPARRSRRRRRARRPPARGRSCPAGSRGRPGLQLQPERRHEPADRARDEDATCPPSLCSPRPQVVRVVGGDERVLSAESLGVAAPVDDGAERRPVIPNHLHRDQGVVDHPRQPAVLDEAGRARFAEASRAGFRRTSASAADSAIARRTLSRYCGSTPEEKRPLPHRPIVSGPS